MERQILKKIALLNQVTLESLIDKDHVDIVRHFTDVGQQILRADFSFAWWKGSDKEKYCLIYRSQDTPYEPRLPRERGGNFEAKKTKSPFFVEDVKSRNYEKKYDVSSYMKSYVIVPITYRDYIYGNIVLCFMEKHIFSDEDRGLATSLGNMAAQSITINNLIEKEREMRQLTEKQEARFKALVENSHEIIMLVDKRGIIQYISSSVEKICGLKPETVIGRRAREFIFNSDEVKVVDYLKKIVNDPLTIHVSEFYFRHKNGSTYCFESTAFNMLGNPNVDGIVVNIRDITEKKKAETLKETERMLREEQIKTEFIANATHEIRTPLAIIRGNVDVALLKLNNKLPPMAVKVFKAINNEIEHLSNMMADLTLLTSKEATLSEGIMLNRVDVSKILSNIIKRCLALSKRRDISIKAKIVSKIMMMGDEAYLEKLFLNIIRNAVNYGTTGGWINIETKVVDDKVIISFADNGIGIKDEDLPNIFNRFYRSDKSHHPDGNSTGLGLAIAKWIVTAHNGAINVASKFGNGTKFIVILPILKLD